MSISGRESKNFHSQCEAGDLRSIAFSKYMDSPRVKSGDNWFHFDKVNNQFHPCDKMSWIQLEGH